MKRGLLSLYIGAWLFAPGVVRPEDEPEPPETIVRIGVLVKAESFKLGCADRFEIFDLASGERKAFQPADELTVDSDGTRTFVGGVPWGSLIRIVSQDGVLRVNGRRYRNTLLVKQAAGARVSAINELAVDEYVYGILPKEVSPAWPMESLKAQAVVSRTFALRNAARHGSDGFGLCSKVHCQVYGGMESEHPQTNAAVDETHNEVLTYDDDLANTVFFANCGGRTDLPSNAWESSGGPPYLRSVRCKYCSSSKHYTWTRKCSAEQIARALAQLDDEAAIRSIAVGSRGKSGRARLIKIRQKGKTVVLRASAFRMSLGPEVIRSTYIQQIKKTAGGDYIFKGRGWGHGVGLCQDGARGMAERGSGYKKIIRFYYPGTVLRRFED